MIPENKTKSTFAMACVQCLSENRSKPRIISIYNLLNFVFSVSPRVDDEINGVTVQYTVHNVSFYYTSTEISLHASVIMRSNMEAVEGGRTCGRRLRRRQEVIRSR